MTNDIAHRINIYAQNDDVIIVHIDVFGFL